MADKYCRAVSGTVYFFPSVFWLAHMDLKVTHYIATSCCGLSLAAWIWTGLFSNEVDVKKNKQQETTGQKNCFSKLWTSHESRPVPTHVFNTAVTAWDLFVWLAQLSGKKPQNQSTNQAEQHLAQTVWLLHIRGQHRLRQEPHPTLFSETLWVAVFLSNHTWRTGDTLFSFPKSKRRVNGLLEKANANPINQSLGWHQALS